MPDDHRKEWERYRARELEAVRPVLAALGYVLDDAQPHTEGERFLMQAVTTASGRKLILLGKEVATGRRVVIKITRDADGKRELAHERTCRKVLRDIGFAYQSFLSPEELFFGTRGAFLISVQAYVDQESAFLARPLEEQFALALGSFKAQESAHATTYGHARLVRRTFGSIDAEGYLEAFKGFRECAGGQDEALTEAQRVLEEHQETLERYCGFLTHTDFVPHNFRVSGGAIYLLDHSSLRFGNKYEGWARFLNFMTLYNRPLEEALVEYVRANRDPEELLALRLMRIYRLGEILCYYTRTLPRSEGDLLALNRARIAFWKEVLVATLADRPVSEETVKEYAALRDSLRSSEEKRRQEGLH